MPWFASKFSPKKTRSRKSASSLSADAQLEDLVQKNRSVKLQVGDQHLVFENGEWVPALGSGSNIHKQNQKLRSRLQEVEEENNLLKLKFEIVLNMMAQMSAENHLKQREIDKLVKTDAKSHSHAKEAI